MTTVRLQETKVKSVDAKSLCSPENLWARPQLWRRFPQDSAGSSPGHPQLAVGSVPVPVRRRRTPSWPILVGWTDLDPQPDGAQRADAVGVGLAVEDWTGDARFYEYSAAVDPIGSGATTRIPIRQFPTQWHDPETTRVVDLDLSGALGTPYPATGPSLLARFLCIAEGDELSLAPNATSMLFYCLRGRGSSEIQTTRGARGRIPWRAGDVVTAARRHGAPAPRRPGCGPVPRRRLTPAPPISASTPTRARFAPTRFDGEHARARLAEVAADPDAARRSRVAVLLGNARNDQTLTATHTLWAMLGVLPEGHVQRPHRHQSIAVGPHRALRPGVLHAGGPRDPSPTAPSSTPTRVDWEPGGAFVTPPGLWHSHHNESGSAANLLPVQDAGLHTYLRTLDIRFTGP